MRIEPDGNAIVAADFVDIDMGADRVLLVRARDGVTRSVERMEAEFLKALRRPCPPEAIPSKLRAMGWEAIDRSWIGDLIDSLGGEGWVGSLESFVRSATEASAKLGPDKEASTLSALTWPTRDRPELLGRGLSAWRQAFESSGLAFPDAVIADDSTREEEVTRSVVERFAGEWGGETFYLERSFRNRLVGELSKLDEEIARFALDPEAPRNQGVLRYGANRNLIALACGGRKIAMSDDDVLPEFRTKAEAGAGIELMLGGDPAMISAFASEAGIGALDSVSFASAFAAHGATLGKRSIALLSEAGSANYAWIDSSSLDKVLDPSTRIGALCFGIWGDSGMANSRYLLVARERLDPESLEGADYESLANSRILFRAPRRPSFGGGFFQGVHVSFDLGQLLPPFAPLGRCEDNLWAASLSRLRPDLIIANPREAARHAPKGRTTARGEVLDFKVRCNEVIAAILPRAEQAGEAAATFRTVGSALAAIATAAIPQFRRWMSERYGQHLSLLVGRMEALMGEYGGASKAWDEDMESAIDDLRERSLRSFSWLPEEFADDEEGFRIYLRRFGLLLQGWPELVEKATFLGPGLLEEARILAKP